ncbi:MAG: pyridoxamine 5'-phosphate oxidase family protein [Desulfobulbales bacterium]|nr:pyridoxamine 5'-phosphate oxidase family protein [Desulfobulbales bacterium]
MINREQLQSEIGALLLSQKLAVLSTQTPEGVPYASLIAFAVTDDLQKIVLATPRATRKFANIRSNPGVALLIDDRSNREQDFHDAKAVTVLGSVNSTVPDPSQEDLALLYLQKHPYLEDFLRAPSTAFIIISVRCYYLVSRFQEVMELHISDENSM